MLASCMWELCVRRNTKFGPIPFRGEPLLSLDGVVKMPSVEFLSGGFDSSLDFEFFHRGESKASTDVLMSRTRGMGEPWIKDFLFN